MVVPSPSAEQLLVEPVGAKGVDPLKIMLQCMMHAAIEVGIGVGPANELHQHRQVMLVVEQRAGGGPAVAAGPADLLVITFQRPWHLGMGDGADVGLVDTHAKGVGGQDQWLVTTQERLLHPFPFTGVETAVVDAVRSSFGFQEPAKAFQGLDQGEVDDVTAGGRSRGCGWWENV